jgi:hypothetical protein
MIPLNRSLDSLESLATDPRPDITKIRALIRSIRDDVSKLNADQQALIESNAALLKRCSELEAAAKNK